MADTNESTRRAAGTTPDTDCAHCQLDCVRKGDHVEIIAVDDEHARVQCLRFGMAEGARVECMTRIPAGPIVVRSGRQEIAVGRSLASRITVRPMAAPAAAAD